MAFNVPQVQVLSDSFDRTVVKVVGVYNASAVPSNTVIVKANTLAFANASRPCVLSVTDITYQCGLGTNTFASIQWVANSATSQSNSDIMILSGFSGGEFGFYMPNPIAANTANLNGQAGDIGLQISSPAGNTSLSFILTLNKEMTGGGYANAYVAYNDPGYVP